jgi:hypothetical protein
MPRFTNKFCACGRPAPVEKNCGNVCERCDKIEQSLDRQLVDSKTRSGMAGAVDCYTVRMPAKSAGRSNNE